MNQQLLSKCAAASGKVYVPFSVSAQLRAAGHDKLAGVEPDSLSGRKVLCIFSSRSSAERYARWLSDICSQQGARGFSWEINEYKFIAGDGTNFGSGRAELVSIAIRLGASGFALDHPETRMQPFGTIPLE